VRIFAGEGIRPPESQTEFAQRKSQPAPPKKCRVSIAESSQFASALLLSAKVGGWEIEVVGENADESPYVAMTAKLIEVFPKNGGTFQIEPDASSGSYFWAAGRLPGPPELMEYTEQFGVEIAKHNFHQTTVASWPQSGWQVDGQFLGVLACSGLDLGLRTKPIEDGAHATIPTSMLEVGEASRKNDLGDSIMTAIILAPLSIKPTKFTDLGRLRVQECERVVALRTELTKCGARVEEEGDTLTVYPSKPEDLRGAVIETYNDHRMAMCFAILGLKVPGIRIKNPACVKKTFPNFFQKLAAAPPHGLGAEIWEVKNGQRTRKMSGQDLFAD